MWFISQRLPLASRAKYRSLWLENAFSQVRNSEKTASQPSTFAPIRPRDLSLLFHNACRNPSQNHRLRSSATHEHPSSLRRSLLHALQSHLYIGTPAHQKVSSREMRLREFDTGGHESRSRPSGCTEPIIGQARARNQEMSDNGVERTGKDQVLPRIQGLQVPAVVWGTTSGGAVPLPMSLKIMFLGLRRKP